MVPLRYIVLPLFVCLFSARSGLAAPPVKYSQEVIGKPGSKDKSGKKGEESGAKPNYDISGYARLSSNFLDRGLTYSHNGFSFNGLVLMNLGSQFKFGFWGANISKLDNDDDNLWLKYVAEVFVDFQNNSKFVFYVHDDHFYKSQSRNGIRYGFRLDYGRFTNLIEWQNNFEGTGESSYYGRAKFNKKYNEKTGVEVGAGYTMQHSTQYSNYFDLSGTTYYLAFPNGRLEAGLTIPSSTQFGERSKLNYFIGMQVNY